jgi:IS1 family transposase
MLERSTIIRGMNKLSAERRVAVLKSLVEGNSIRATVRMTGVAKNTVVKLLEEAGKACLAYQQEHMVDLPCKLIQCDEIWSFVFCKERQVEPALRGQVDIGDAWTWTAIDAETKLVPAFHVGKRTRKDAHAFVTDLSGRLANRVQLTTDGLKLYLTAVEKAFGWNGVDYAMLEKIYGDTMEDEKRYSPAVCIGAEKTWVMGTPDEKLISTSYVERQNLTMRMQIRRFTRLTNAFSKKLENHRYAVALHFMHYNYCRSHMTLTQAAKGIHTTPAMASGLSDHVWKVEELEAVINDYSN